MFSKFLTIAMLLLLCGGCVAVGEKYSTVVHRDQAKALVLAYRPHPPVDILLNNTYAYVHAADLYLGDRKIAPLNVNSYTYFEVDSGIQVFTVREQLLGGVIQKLEFKLQAGQRYYLRYLFRLSVAAQAGFSFRVIPAEIAEKEIIKTRYVSTGE